MGMKRVADQKEGKKTNIRRRRRKIIKEEEDQGDDYEDEGKKRVRKRKYSRSFRRIMLLYYLSLFHPSPTQSHINTLSNLYSSHLLHSHLSLCPLSYSLHFHFPLSSFPHILSPFLPEEHQHQQQQQLVFSSALQFFMLINAFPAALLPLMDKTVQAPQL